MKILYIKRNTKYEKRYTPRMGELTTKVTYIKRYMFGFPVKTLHKYQKTYFGGVKSCDQPMLFV